ncbi:MAG TPA: arginine--tRNA ligase, partial [Micromonosporaceae bacterium]
LDRLDLLHDSDGARCAFPAGFTGRDGGHHPIIVRKRDGGFGYGATDLAAIRYRTREIGATRLLYVIGSPQRQHLEMVFQSAREAGWLTAPARAEHVAFGQVLGADGRRFASRAGETIKLIDLLEEAAARSAVLVADANPDLDAPTRATVAKAVGIGAIKYAELASDRLNDYVFDWDRMLSFHGETGAYLQMAHARIQSILGKAGVAAEYQAAFGLGEPAERALALELLAFPAVVDEVAGTLRLHRLSGHLQAVAGAYTTFYEQCPVLRAAGAVRASRLALCALTGRVLATGLGLLGIQAPSRM